MSVVISLKKAEDATVNFSDRFCADFYLVSNDKGEEFGRVLTHYSFTIDVGGSFTTGSRDSIAVDYRDSITVDSHNSFSGGFQFCSIADEPSFPGGQKAWTQYLTMNFKYPPEAIEKKYSGNRNRAVPSSRG